MNGGTPPGFIDATIIDSQAAFHGTSSTFNFADGHVEAHKWLDSVMIKYAKSMDSNKYSNTPNYGSAPNDTLFLAKRYVTALNK